MTHTSLTDIKWQDAVVKNRQHYPRHSYQLMITDFGVGHRCMGAGMNSPTHLITVAYIRLTSARM